jgi:hypothetical protein
MEVLFMSTAKQAARIMMLVEEGMSLEDAIQKVLAETAPVTQDNRIEHIMKLENIEAIQKFQKRAQAKKSKSRHNPEAVLRYEAEIQACKNRIGELKLKLQDEPSTLKGLIKLGAKTSTVVQAWLKEKETALEKDLETLKASKKLSNKAIKALIKKQPRELPEAYETELRELGEDYLNNVVERLEKGDQRIIALVQKAGLIS